MNQLIRPESINFHDLVKNSNTTLSLNLQTQMVTLLNEKFTEEQQKWYIAMLFMYLNYHPTMDFPINLEIAVKILGFAHKRNAKRTLENNFTLNEDYKVIKLPREQKQNAGRCEEEIMLNMDTFKHLCMLVKTSEGKAVRKYYVTLESINNEIIKMEIQKQLEEKDEKLKKLTRVINHEITEIVYVFECKYKDGIVYKIGRTKNGNRRESELITGNINGEMIFTLSCLNNNLIEKLAHQLLDNYRMDINREWFNCDLQVIINALNYSKLVTEDVLNQECDFKYLFDEFKKQLTRNTEIKPIKREIDVHKDIILNVTPYKTNKIDDYDKFLDECCEITNNKADFISFKELKAVYSIWSHDNEFVNWQNTLEYFTKRFTVVKNKLDNLCRTKKECFQGIKFKESLYNFENSLQEEYNLNIFLFEKCKKGPFYQIAHNELYYEYEKFNKELNAEYTFTTLEKTKLDNHFNITFLRSKVGTVVGKKDNRIYGWKGVSLTLNIKYTDYKVLPNKLNSKKVLQYSTDNVLLKTFNSQREVAMYLNMSTSAVNTNMKKCKLINDPNINTKCYFKYDILM